MSSAADPQPAPGARQPAERGSRRVFRQRAAVGSFVVGSLVIAFVLLGVVLQGKAPTLGDVLWCAAVLSVLWVLFMRPAVLLDQVGITFRNLVRNVHIPWGAVGGTEERWNLVVWTERDDQSYTAWAIGSRPERPRGVGPVLDPGRLGPLRSVGSEHGDASGGQSTKATSAAVGALITRTKGEFDRAVSAGLLPAGERTVRRSWAWDAIVPLGASLLALAIYHLVR